MRDGLRPGLFLEERIVWPIQVNCSLRRPLNLPGGTALRLAMRVQKEGKPKVLTLTVTAGWRELLGFY